MDTTKVQPGEPMSFIGVTYGNRVRGYLQEQKWLKGSSITKAHPGWVTAHKSWDGAPCTTCNQLNRLDSVLSRCLSWSNFFQAAQLVFDSSKQLVSESSLELSFILSWEGLSAFIVYSRRAGPSESGQFQGLPETILWCLASCFKVF